MNNEEQLPTLDTCVTKEEISVKNLFGLIHWYAYENNNILQPIFQKIGPNNIILYNLNKFNKKEITIGRQNDNDILLPNIQSLQSSNKHAKIIINNKSCLFKRINQKNRINTWINGQKVEHDKDYELNHNDIIRLGSELFIFRDDFTNSISCIKQLTIDDITVDLYKLDFINNEYYYQILPIEVIKGGSPEIINMIIGPEQKKHLINIEDMISTTLNHNKTLLIVGETGVGKELLTRYIHIKSGRKTLISINMAQLKSENIPIELFGIAQDTFTGVKGKTGRFHLANRGTLFMDEIGEIDFSTQAQLLRVIETGEIVKVGDSTEKEKQYVDVFLIGATNKKLQCELNEGVMRSDFISRMGYPNYINILPLRKRREEIPLACILELTKLAIKDGKKITGSLITSDVLEKLCLHPFNKNMRELSNIIVQMYVNASTREKKDLSPIFPIIFNDLPEFLKRDNIKIIPEDNKFANNKNKEFEDFKNKFFFLFSFYYGNISQIKRVLNLDTDTIRKILKNLSTAIYNEMNSKNNIIQLNLKKILNINEQTFKKLDEGLTKWIKITNFDNFDDNE